MPTLARRTLNEARQSACRQCKPSPMAPRTPLGQKASQGPRKAAIGGPDQHLKPGVLPGEAPAIPRNQLLAEIAGLEPEDELDAGRSVPGNCPRLAPARARGAAAIGEPRIAGNGRHFGAADEDRADQPLPFTVRRASPLTGRARHVLPGNHRPGARPPNLSLEDRRSFR
jgi:hypothetical protein